MDESTISARDEARARRIRDGFPGQRMRVLPRPLISQAAASPATSQLLVTDVGFFPRASSHGRVRGKGAPQHIVIVCAAGRGTCRLPSGTHAVTAGQALLIAAGTPHVYEADLDDPWTIWWFHVVGRAVPELFAATTASTERPVIGLGDPPRVLALIDTMIRRMERDETMSSLVAASGAAWHALALLAADRRAVGASAHDPVEGTLEFLRANFSERSSVGELAEMAGLSRSHYAARFRRATGFGVLEYQTRLRMAAARELLDTTDRTVSSIAQQVGYADALYFSRQFRRIHSTSPSEYRSHERG
ncbi:helix-turn-helix domain-containing protein [Cellulomonas sp. Marseille-Q8402]